MNKPLLKLKHFNYLKLSDFEEHSIWVNCHLEDNDKPWYKLTNEETFRPWDGDIPIDPSQSMFLVKSNFTLADGTLLSGFVTPVEGSTNDPNSSLSIIQPHIIHNSGRVIRFWFGAMQPSTREIESAYDLLQKTSEQVFPIFFEAEDGLVRGLNCGSIPGFCYMNNIGEMCVNR